jgi:hypothetical protein
VADYDAKIRVSADTKQAESEISKLQQRLNKLSDAAFKLDATNFQKSVKDIGTAVQGIGQRGALGALTLAAGKATTALGGLGAKFGILGAAAASAGATVNGALGGIPAVITDILNQVGQIPNAFGIAAVAALAFAPQVLKASAAVTGLGAAVDNAIGKQTTEKIADAVNKFGQLKLEIDATNASFQELISGSTLNQLNAQLKDAVKQSGEFLSSTDEAVTAAQQLVAVQREQRKEQKAINDLIRQAQGLQPQDVRDTEVARRVALLKSREVQQRKDLQLQSQINAELAEYAKIAEQVAAQTKQWASNLERVSRTSKAGALGTQSQLRTRLQEFQENRRSAEIARQRSAEILAFERGGQYSLGQVPVRGELFPGGRTETAAPQFRERLNTQALAQQALEKAGRSRLQIEASIFKQSKQISEVQQEQNKLDERSIQLAKERNKLLLEQFRAEQRVASGVLDPASLRADRQRRVTEGRETAARRREALSNAVIGGAFPLLFGQGAGAALGGGLGGAAGGFAGGQFGFGLSLVGTALGTVLDQFTKAAIDSGKALQDPITNFQKIADAGLLASRSQKQYIERLIEAGRVTEAATVIQDELIKKIGVQGVQDLQNAGAASDKLNKALAEFSLQAQAAVAGPLADILTWLSGVIAVGNQVNRQAAQQADILQGLSPEDRTTLQREEQRILQGANLFNEAQKRQQVSQLYQSFAGRANIQRPGTSIDQTPELQAKAQTQELAAQVQLEGQKLTLAGMSLEMDGQSYVAAAKRVAQQEYENKLLEIKNSWIGKAYDAERNQLLIKQANLQLAGKIREIEAQAAKAAEKANQDAIRAYQQRLQLQNQLAQTTLDEYRIFEQGVDLLKGPIAGYEKSLILLERRTAIQEGIILNELESARVSEDYAANQQVIEAIYANRLGNLKREADYLKQQLDVQKERAQLEQAISLRQLQFQNNQRRVAGQTEIETLQTQLQFPFGGEQLERELQLLDQYTRRINELKPLQEEIQTTQQTITAAEKTPGLLTEDQLNASKQALAIQQDQLTQLTAELQVRDQLEQQLLRQQQIYAKYGFIADEVSRAFSDSISGIITGTTTVAEAFGRMFENIGKAFIDMATQVLAQKLFFTIVSSLTSGLGGGFSFSGAGPVSGASVFGAGQAGFNPAAFGGTSFFAEGGFVTGPTRALIGEGGEPEYVIPASKMGSAMARYATGARGEGVLGGAVAENRAFLDSLTTKVGGSVESAADEPSDGTVATRAAIRESERFQENRMQIMSQQTALERRYERERLEKMTSEPGYLNVKYESQVINNVEYVTRDQAERLATQSALRGRELAIGALQNSVKTRKRVGMS